MSEERIPIVVAHQSLPHLVPNTVALKVAVVALAVMIVAAPVAYAAFKIHGLSAPYISAWRWPAIGLLGVAFVTLAWWVNQSVQRRFPYS